MYTERNGFRISNSATYGMASIPKAQAHLRDLPAMIVRHNCLLAIIVVLMLVTGLAGISACSQQAQTAEDFLRDLYAPYESGDAPSPTGSAAPALFEPGLLALIQRDRQLANGEVGLIDHDPICACQDYDPLTEVRISLEPSADGRTSAKVSFMNGSQPVTVGFQLVTVQGRWHIYDVEEAGLPSLRNFLEAGIANLTNTQKPQ